MGGVVEKGRRRYDGPSVADRTFRFAVRCVRLIRHLEEQRGRAVSVTSSLERQLLRSATSIGANLEEAQAAESRRDFLHKTSIAQKEARETTYWPRLLRATEIIDNERTEDLADESHRLLRIISSIAANTARNSKQSDPRN